MMVLLTNSNERLEIPDTVKVTQYKQEPDYEIVRAPFTNLLRVANDGLPRPNPIQLSGNVYFNSETEATNWIFNLKNNMNNVASFYDSGEISINVSHFNFSAIPTLIPRVIRLSMNIYPVTTSLNNTSLFPRIIDSVGSLKETASGLFSVRMPTSIMPGDLLLMILRSSTLSVTPSGWSQIATHTSGGTTYIYAKTATSDDRNNSFVNVNNGAGTAAALCYKIKQQNGLPEASSISGTNPPSLVPSWGGNQYTAVIAVVTTGRTDNVFTPPSGYTNLREISNPSIVFSYKIVAADDFIFSSAFNPLSFSSVGSTLNSHAFTIGVRR